MKNENQKQMCDFLLENGIQNLVGVPDSTLKYFISQGMKKKKNIIATREEEAIGIGTGMTLSNSPTVVYMQNAGFANSISAITSLVQLYKIPLLFIIGWRGYLKNDAPEHELIGKIQPELLKLIGLESRIVTDSNWEKNSKWALKKIQNQIPCALIVRRMKVE
jgi:sulfopyruvate decarboxylase TPP-binding subunit